jgi:hypothetical protein
MISIITEHYKMHKMQVYIFISVSYKLTTHNFSLTHNNQKSNIWYYKIINTHILQGIHI